MKKFLFLLITSLFFSTAFAQINTDGKGGIGTLPPKGFPITTDSTVNMDLPTYRERIFGTLDLSAANIPSGCLMEYSLFGWDKTKYNIFCSIDFSL